MNISSILTNILHCIPDVVRIFLPILNILWILDERNILNLLFLLLAMTFLLAIHKIASYCNGNIIHM